MKNSVVVWGMGEMGSVFARAALRSGHPVIPVVREADVETIASHVSEPEMVIVAVGEADLHHVLERMPHAWRFRLVLLQNELLPEDWRRYDFHPTVISVWFEKKKGQDVKVLIPSPCYGRHAGWLAGALASIGIPARELTDENELLYELVLKNVYILTTNIAGLETGGSVRELWQNHEALAHEVAMEVIALQEKLIARPLESEKLIQGMLYAFDGDPDHPCMGRSAPARLQRALQLAQQHGLELPRLRAIAERGEVNVEC